MAPLISTIMMNRLCEAKDSWNARKGIYPAFFLQSDKLHV